MRSCRENSLVAEPLQLASVSFFFLHQYCSVGETLPEHTDHLVDLNATIEQNLVYSSSASSSHVPILAWDPESTFTDALRLLAPDAAAGFARTQLELPPRYLQHQRLTDMYPGALSFLGAPTRDLICSSPCMQNSNRAACGSPR